MSKFVVLTGSFNPVTRAHRIILESAIEAVGADSGLFVETNDAYLTRKLVVDRTTPDPFHLSAEVRAEMLRSLQAQNPRLGFWGQELGNESPSTYPTLKAIMRDHKGDELYYLAGADKLAGIPHWSNAEDMLSHIHLVVFPRGGINLNEVINASPLLTKFKDRIVLLDSIPEAAEISSTEVRRRFFRGEDYTSLMDLGPASILSRYSPSDFKPLTQEEVIQATLRFGGRFGGTAARKLVFNDNVRIYKTLDDRFRKSKVYRYPFRAEGEGSFVTETGVVNQDCADVAEELLGEGLKPAILNLASAIKPCGGFNEGAGAQEESLCYMSSLPMSLYPFGNPRLKAVRNIATSFAPGVYPLDRNFGGIYTPEVLFFRNNLDQSYSLRKNTFICPVISVASLGNTEHREFCSDERCYFRPDGTLTEEGLAIETNKVRTIFRIAIDNQRDSLVLGAFGCGVYHLIPSEVASLFKSVLGEPDFKGKFKKIVFAIFEGKGSKRKTVGKEGKFKAFYDAFGEM